jgi:hypothetical protein
MAEVNETTQRQCDRCAVQSEPAVKGSVPDGWLSRLGLHVTDTNQVFNDLCPVCAGLPVVQAVVPVPSEEPA